MAESGNPTDKTHVTLDAGSARAIASLLKTMGTDRFAPTLRQALKTFCPFDSMMVTRYPAHGPPVTLFHDLDDIQAAISVQFYETGPYLLDPLYIACKSGRNPGIYRTLDLAPEAFFRSEYFRAFYRNIRIRDEAGVLIRLEDGEWIIVSLALSQRKAGFPSADLDRLKALFPILSAAVERTWSDQEGKDPPGLQRSLEDSFETFGADVLSPRQGEIVRLILQGHSTPSAAAYLGISEGTVKVHRHNAYAKLGVSSQAELFSMATRYFTMPGSGNPG
ncbi:MAG: LuxR C-terminal-related transcriptional regulator [Rhodospirillum sp.]|nr:LuxR C-terminal-related transcriptional regulator [Rhodospirillum sp.]MCF8491191.1 LuxR C-terminal-related transcriptional regulator [Rhodospirillum sp.]MCF8499613.1 LuxR C-terminal-related transcriptional regulator [Rhodospirillum sp.]